MTLFQGRRLAASHSRASSHTEANLFVLDLQVVRVLLALAGRGALVDHWWEEKKTESTRKLACAKKNLNLKKAHTQADHTEAT